MADGFAAKGALHALLRRPGSNSDADGVDVFLTHLESYDPKVREAQYLMLAEFIRLHSSSVRPALILGDFNTDGRPQLMRDAAAPYHRMVKALHRSRADASLTDIWPDLSSDPGGTNDQQTAEGGERIDYIFVSNPIDGGASLRPIAVRVNRFLDTKVASLSDHSAVEADLQWDTQRR
jgi:endonuclease/exonuclease/phosphatase family metal-dependent hydrolase